MSISSFTLTNNKSGKSFELRGVAPVGNTKSQPVVDIPIINSSPDDVLLFRLTGQSEELTLEFAIFDDGVDVSNGDSVVSVNDQILYLRDTIYTADFDTSWNIQNDRFYPDGVTVTITNLSFDNQAGGVNIVTGSLSLRRGKVGTFKSD